MHENGQRIGEMPAEAIQELARTAEPRAGAALRGDGEAANGQVRAVAGDDGRLRERVDAWLPTDTSGPGRSPTAPLSLSLVGSDASGVSESPGLLRRIHSRSAS
ncbi:hypothetical protein EDD27_7931 [Nonomuraea polychroma]|uniref:Uncharacterized protein n=1 Tax=Nonomuraea polychroma TaxID=46176 RepID=A0A438MHC9_9ACTN|nr:hypothetical protein EDD27_7931 [Nonomuraea polychroma]